MTTEQRLETLEKKLVREKWYNRCLLLVLVAVVILVGNLGATSSSSAVPEIRASKFIVVDENGKSRAVLGASKDTTVMFLCDENGKIHTSLSTDKNGSAFDMRDKNGVVRATLSTLPDGSVGLSMCDNAGNGRAMLSINKTGLVGLSMRDDNGKLRAWLSTDKDGPQLNLFDKNEKVLWVAPR